MLRWVGLVVLAVQAAVGPSAQPCGPSNAVNVSLIQLIAAPERYEGKNVRVEGILHHRFEDSVLYLSRDFADHLSGKNGVWIRYASSTAVCLQPEGDYHNRKGRNLDYFDGKWVVIEGTFDPAELGHLNENVGTIKDTYLVSEGRRFK